MISGEVSQTDMARFTEAMQRFQTEFGKEPLEAVKWASNNLARSLKAGTKSAKKFPVVNSARASGSDKRKYWQAFNDVRNEPEHLKYRQARFKKSEVGAIYKRSRFGLAKRIWGIILSKAGSGRGAGAKGSEAKFADVAKDENPSNPSFTLHDLLSYAVEALDGITVAEASEKAAKSMFKKMDAGLVKAMKGNR